jgi:membrane-associated phospholipid phosphatase
VAAGAASTVLAYLFPNNAKLFSDQAEATGRSQLLAGVQFPSDVAAGLELGRAVAELVIARARTDGSDAVFTGAIPKGPCSWRGANPAESIPRDAAFFEAQSREGAESRIWAGIHFRSDIEVGLALGRAVVEKVIERARNDGAQ